MDKKISESSTFYKLLEIFILNKIGYRMKIMTVPKTSKVLKDDVFEPLHHNLVVRMATQISYIFANQKNKAHKVQIY